jgi:hypothetical protein
VRDPRIAEDVDPGSGMEKIWIRDGKKSDPGWKKFGYGMEKIWVRDGKNLDPGWKKFGSGLEKK